MRSKIERKQFSLATTRDLLIALRDSILKKRDFHKTQSISGEVVWRTKDKGFTVKHVWAFQRERDDLLKRIEDTLNMEEYKIKKESDLANL